MSKRRRWGFKRARVGFWAGIGGVDVAVEMVEAGAMLTWQPMWWRCTKMGGGDADVATDAGAVDDDALVGDVARRGAANRR